MRKICAKTNIHGSNLKIIGAEGGRGKVKGQRRRFSAILYPVSLYRKFVLGKRALQLGGAFTEIAKQVPLNPKHNSDKGFNSYQWGYDPVPLAQRNGQRTYEENSNMFLGA